MKKLILTLLLLVAVVAVFLVVVNHKGAVGSYTVRSQQTEMTVEAAPLFSEFERDETRANEKYLNKVIAVTGTVALTKQSSDGSVAVTLASQQEGYGVRCHLDRRAKHARTTFNVGEKVTFKGVCMGTIRDVELENCVEE